MAHLLLFGQLITLLWICQVAPINCYGNFGSRQKIYTLLKFSPPFEIDLLNEKILSSWHLV